MKVAELNEKNSLEDYENQLADYLIMANQFHCDVAFSNGREASEVHISNFFSNDVFHTEIYF